MLEIVLLVFVALFSGCVTADRRDVDHAVAELDKGTALDGDVEVGDVVEDPINLHQQYSAAFSSHIPLGKSLVSVFTNP